MERNTNDVTIAGVIATEFEFSHRLYEVNFYKFTLMLKRLSDKIDYIPVIISERLIDVNRNMVGQFIEIFGEFRSRNERVDDRSRLILNVFAKDIILIDEVDFCNNIILEGYICKKPNYRNTPLGKTICDMLVAVNAMRNTYYIPCIAWRENAIKASEFEIGQKVSLKGRIQSRDYIKKIDDDLFEWKIAYEVSIKELEVI